MCSAATCLTSGMTSTDSHPPRRPMWVRPRAGARWALASGTTSRMAGGESGESVEGGNPGPQSPAPRERAGRAGLRAWRIMQPVRGQIWRAMGLAAMVAPLAAAAACVAGSYLMRLAGFNQSHHAAFRLEAVLRQQLARHLTRVPL